MNVERVNALFALVNLGRPTLQEESIIAEFFDSEVVMSDIVEFGFNIV